MTCLKKLWMPHHWRFLRRRLLWKWSPRERSDWEIVQILSWNLTYMENDKKRNIWERESEPQQQQWAGRKKEAKKWKIIEWLKWRSSNKESLILTEAVHSWCWLLRLKAGDIFIILTIIPRDARNCIWKHFITEKAYALLLISALYLWVFSLPQNIYL